MRKASLFQRYGRHLLTFGVSMRNREGQLERFPQGAAPENAMAAELRLALGIASLIGLAAGATTALAQANRPWVDPPPETNAAPQAPVGQTKPGSAPVETAAPAKPVRSERAAAGPDPAHQGHPAEATVGQQPQPATSETGDRGSSTQAVTSTGSLPQAQPPAVHRNAAAAATKREAKSARTRHRAVAERSPLRKQARVGEQAEDGLRATSVRIIEFPDGRRIVVRTKPDPDVVQDLMTRHYSRPLSRGFAPSSLEPIPDEGFPLPIPY